MFSKLKFADFKVDWVLQYPISEYSLIKIVLINQIFKANVLVSAKDMVPPKDPYIKVRVLDDLGEGIVVSDKAANFARHSMHFLKRTDAEPYISRVSASLTCF